MRPINSEHLEQYIGHCAIEVHELVISHEFQNPGRPRVVEHQHIGSKRRQSMMLHEVKILIRFLVIGELERAR